ncbi:MAG TPA: hypothetical protein VHA33_00225 [Candidatus Angelobacter sp.]|jgi:hypothetical protein|nr:hypothetical protein [Candidatus Angelobacter sp.]
MAAARAALKIKMKTLSKILILLLFPAIAVAHVGSPDVYYEGKAGPYSVQVVVRVPPVIPGVAEVEVKTLSGNVNTVRMVPLRIQGLGAELAPVADIGQRSLDDARSFHAGLWLMQRGAWKVQVTVEGDLGHGELSIPVAAAPTIMRPMQWPLRWLLGILMTILAVGFVGMAGAAVREGISTPGATALTASSNRARKAMVFVALFVVVVLTLGGIWWKSEAADTSRWIYSVPRVKASLVVPNALSITLKKPDTAGWAQRTKLNDLIPDHGHLVHLFLVRVPQLDRMVHLHPGGDGSGAEGQFLQTLPAMPAGRYQVFADIVHSTGFPETQISEIVLPEIQSGTPQGDDSSVSAAPLNQSAAGQTATLDGGMRMRWLNEPSFHAGEPIGLRFRVEDAAGAPATDLEPYMGMAGHLVVVREDCQVFAHLHPGWSAPMATVELASGASAMKSMDHASDGAVSPEIVFPYGFPEAGRYRLFVQVRHAGKVETGVFDAQVTSGGAKL